MMNFLSQTIAPCVDITRTELPLLILLPPVTTTTTTNSFRVDGAKKPQTKIGIVFPNIAFNIQPTNSIPKVFLRTTIGYMDAYGLSIGLQVASSMRSWSITIMIGFSLITSTVKPSPDH
jgi:hypothetical protein